MTWQETRSVIRSHLAKWSNVVPWQRTNTYILNLGNLWLQSQRDFFKQMYDFLISENTQGFFLQYYPHPLAPIIIILNNILKFQNNLCCTRNCTLCTTHPTPVLSFIILLSVSIIITSLPESLLAGWRHRGNPCQPHLYQHLQCLTASMMARQPRRPQNLLPLDFALLL